mgnify:CR=1 FL=1
MDEFINYGYADVGKLADFANNTTIGLTANDIMRFPKAEVQPVKHGYWYHNTSKYISELDAYFIQACCSCCGRYSDRIDSYSQLMSNECCSHCGARMDGDKE